MKNARLDVVAAEAPGGLGQVVGAEREEVGDLGDLAGGQRGPRQLDHGADREVAGATPCSLGHVGDDPLGLVARRARAPSPSRPAGS